jgi:primary-amine oxidase
MTSRSRNGDRSSIVTAAAALVSALLIAQTAQAQPTHPLDPLTADELLRVRDFLTQSGQFSAGSNFAWIGLDEPPKHIVQAFTPGSSFPRKAYVAVIDYDERKTYAVVIDLAAGGLSSLTDLNGLQPGLNDLDSARARDVIDADPRVKAALINRGFAIPGKISDAVNLQLMAVGHDPSLSDEKGRLMRVLFGADQGTINESGPYLDGLMAVVDLYSKQVIRLYEAAGAPRVKVPHDIFDPKIRGSGVAANAVVPTQPQGKSFDIAGNVLTWGNWQLRFSFNLREGLVLHQVAFDDNGRMRSVLYRGSIAEVLTAYGDPSDFLSWMQIFDEGEFGLGYLAAELQAGREVPANAVMLSPLLPDPTAAEFSQRLSGGIYVYERDGGNLLLYQQGSRVIHARSTELVIGFIASLGNYSYGFNWVFRQDGSFVFEVELSGQIVTRLVRAETCSVCEAARAGAGSETKTYEPHGDDRYGTLIRPQLVGVNHQHWFSLRLDFDVDGPANAVVENTPARDATDNSGDGERATGAFIGTRTVLGRAVEAARNLRGHGMPSWTIYNPSSSRNAGHPAGYTVVPMENSITALPRSAEKETAGFTFHHFWVTPYRDGRLYAAGTFPNQSPRGYTDTLYHYADASSVYDTDVVVWYSLGETHIPRVEDFPLMSTKKVSVVFQPDGFFERNPALGAAHSFEK